jgi:translation initiation factor 2 alpha subunit (eIF-2alpha)
VLCTVDKIDRTTVFVKIEGDGLGTIITSEIAPGRIRNLRDYVVPGKKIVCKVLRIDSAGNIHLSLRRVISKEKKEVLERHEKEKSFVAVLKNITPKSEEISGTIKQKEGSLYDFFEKAKENHDLLKQYFNTEETEKLLAILKEKEKKEVFVKSEFKLFSDLPDGLNKLKEILLMYKEKITYLAAGRYMIKIMAMDYKKANSEMLKILEEIEKKAKSLKIKFERKEK